MAIDRRGIEAADVAGRRDDARPAEERLREALEFRERLFAASAVGLLVYDDEGRCVMVNDAASRAIGGSREQLLSQNFRGLASWRASGLLDLAEDALATGEDRAGVLRIVTTFGRDAWWDCRLTPFSAGGRRHLLLQVNDVGERRRAEAALLASEARFRAFMRHFPGLAYIKDGEGRVLFANEGFARHLGLDPEKLLGRTNEEIFGPGTGGAFAAEDSRVLASGGDSAVEEEVQGRIWATRKFCIAEPGAPPLLGGITIDISERKRAEDALADERARIQAVLENLPMGVVVYDGVPFRSVLQNAAAEVILGRPAPGAIEEAALAGYFEAMRAGTDEPYPAERMPLVQALRGKRTAVDDMDVRRPDGTRVPLEVFGIPIASPSGAPAAVVVFLDITERRRWEAVTVARARLAEFASGRALDEILTRAVDDAEALTGSRIGFCHFLEPDERHFSVQVFSTRTNREFCTAEGLGLHCDLDRAGVWVDCVRERRPVIHNDVASLPHRKGMPEGHPAVVRELVVPVFRDEKIVAMLGVGNKATDYDESDVRMVALFADLAWDFAERKRAEARQRRLEEQLVAARRMESIGLLAGGVAHDFNNMLTPILGNAEILLQELGADDGRRERVEHIVRAAERSKDLVRQLLAFARRQTLEMRPVDLNAVVEGFQRMLRRTLRENVAIETRLAPDVGMVLADAGQMEQILLNIALNAQDAMPGGGLLAIETGVADLDEAYAAAHDGVAPGRYASLALSDTGCGMDGSVRSRIFEPFFTTKGPGRGTGLGLATVYGIVRQHRGSVSVYSEPGMGSTFRIYLPRLGAVEKAAEEATAAAAGPAAEEATAAAAGPAAETEAGTGTLLVVEDEADVRSLAVDALRRNGYSVIEAPGAQAALAAAAAHAGAIDLLVTDVVLADENGRELYERLAALRPGLKVLYMSGYTGEVIDRHGVLAPGVTFLQKPFSLRGLAQKVREALSAP